MGEQLDDQGPLVREKTLELKLKVLEQRLTIKMIAAIAAIQVAPHLSIPSSVTAGVIVVGGVVTKLALVLVGR